MGRTPAEKLDTLEHMLELVRDVDAEAEAEAEGPA
jgi:hypothetical protein